jgi:hypothetical protein
VIAALWWSNWPVAIWLLQEFLQLQNPGFNGALLGAMTMVLFVKIAGRKKGISPHLTLYHALIQ